jgi:putative ABC transport system permease protein
MFKATLKSLAAHKVRLALTGLAIVLGVSFMAGTFVLTDTVKHSFDTLFQEVNAKVDVVVQGKAPYGTGGLNNNSGGNRPLVPISVVSAVRNVPGVRDAEPIIQAQVTVIKPNGKALTKRQAPTLGVSWDPDRALSSLRLVAGRAPSVGNEVVIDRGTMNSQHWSVGQTVRIITPNAPPQPFHITGVVTFGNQNSLLGATLIAFPLPRAEQLLMTPGYAQQINVAAKPGADVNAVINGVNHVLQSNLEAVTGAVSAQQMANQVNQFVSVFNTFLLTFALIALFVGAFLIANTFSILIGQRTRELALLRAVGASRSQVTRSMLGEALVVGLVGSIVGLVIGIPIALGLEALLRAFGFAPPASGIQILPRTIIVSLLVGTVVTLVSAIGPSLRASRIPPVAALREDTGLADASLRRRAVVGGVLSVIGLGLLFDGLFGHIAHPIPIVGAGAAITFIGVATLAPFVAGRLAQLIGAPLPALTGVTGKLGQANAARNPRRTAATASALMVGLALVACIGTLGASINSSFSAVIDRSVKASYVLTASGNGQISRVAEPAVRAAPGVVASSPYTTISWHQGRSGKQATAVDPATAPLVLTFVMVRGSYNNLARGQLLVDDKVFRDDHFHLGQTLPMGFVDTGVINVPIGGTFKTNQFLGNYVVSYAFAAAHVAQLQDQAIMVKTATTGPAQQAALESALSQYPNLKVQTAAQFKADQKKQFSTLLNLVYVLLAFSILIASFGVVNTMALSVIERTREIGLLRSIGMARRQVRTMIRGEAVVVALLGAVLGLVLGVALGAAIVHAASNSGITILSIPVPTIIVILVVAGRIGVGGAVFPARRAARLDILQAIAAE